MKITLEEAELLYNRYQIGSGQVIIVTLENGKNVLHLLDDLYKDNLIDKTDYYILHTMRKLYDTDEQNINDIVEHINNENRLAYWDLNDSDILFHIRELYKLGYLVYEIYSDAPPTLKITDYYLPSFSLDYYKELNILTTASVSKPEILTSMINGYKKGLAAYPHVKAIMELGKEYLDGHSYLTLVGESYLKKTLKD